jgi:hypothetical protein
MTNGDIVLTYCSSLVTEDLSGYDVAEVRANGIVVDEPSESSAWEERVVEINNVAGDTLTIEWFFDSVDSLYNDYRGWHVDGIQISSMTTDCDSTTCVADTNGDNAVNVADLMAVIDQWGTAGSTADVNGDGIVDVNDLLLVSANWGECP